MTYVPKPATVEAFTEGDCWRLATNLRRLTGLPLAFACMNPDQPEIWCHVGLTLADRSAILDVQGVTDVWEWRDRWALSTGSITFADTDADIEALLDNEPVHFPEHNARALARRLLNAFDVPTTGRRHRDALPVVQT